MTLQERVEKAVGCFEGCHSEGRFLVLDAHLGRLYNACGDSHRELLWRAREDAIERIQKTGQKA